MTLRGFAASGLFAAAIVAPVPADGGNALVSVSAQVVRSCRVTTDLPQVSVNCGTRPQPMQISYAGAPTESTLTGPTPVLPASATSVTIHF